MPGNPARVFDAARAEMTFSASTFTVETNGTATIVFQAKWHSEADELCRGWTHDHWQELSTRGDHGSELPPIIKVRLARADERAAYNAEGGSVEFYEGVKLVYLIDPARL